MAQPLTRFWSSLTPRSRDSPRSFCVLKLLYSLFLCLPDVVTAQHSPVSFPLHFRIQGA